jgi:endonuclease G
MKVQPAMRVDAIHSSKRDMRILPHQLVVRFITACLLVLALSCEARIGVEFQMPLGNPSSANTDSNNHAHYLIKRSVFAMDYDDHEAEPNWVAWDLTADDIGPAKRTPTFHADSELPATFHHITSADYKGSGFDRGHMCPSADRTDNAQDNDAVFTMANIIPQAADNNQGVWEHLEADCRDWARQGNELLIICGPAGFSGDHIGPVAVPSHTWKIVVVVPNSAGSVLSRISTATRVIAVNIPNKAGVRHDPWSKYLVSVNDLEKLTGLKFFTALAPEIAAVLKAKVDGQASQTVTTIAVTPTPQNQATTSQTDWVPIAICVVVFLLVLTIIVLVLFFRSRPKRQP